MTYLDAAIEVLRTSRRPLSTAEIVQRMLNAGLVATSRVLKKISE
ncbi:MAG: HTH domain-containing protein [Candidatus Dormibacteria bacterium]